MKICLIIKMKFILCYYLSRMDKNKYRDYLFKFHIDSWCNNSVFIKKMLRIQLIKLLYIKIILKIYFISNNFFKY